MLGLGIGNGVIIRGGGGGDPVPNTANPIKTGQTISYIAGDDGDLQEGRLTDFITLDFTNPYGNTNRFTDEFGGQDFVNKIFIDWSSYKPSDNTVIGYNIDDSYIEEVWDDAVTGSAATSIGTFTSGWRLVNYQEASKIGRTTLGLTRFYNYAPINATSFRFWTSTTFPTNINRAYRVDNLNFSINNRDKIAGDGKRLPVRTFTWNGTALT